MLTLIRHAQTHANAAHLLQGSTDSQLTPLGVSQAQALPGNRVFRPWTTEAAEAAEAPFPRPTRLYISPLGRVRATAAPLSTALGLEPSVRPALAERDFGARECTRRGVHVGGFERGRGKGEGEGEWRERVRREGGWLLEQAGLAAPLASASTARAAAGAGAPSSASSSSAKRAAPGTLADSTAAGSAEAADSADVEAAPGVAVQDAQAPAQGDADEASPGREMKRRRLDSSSSSSASAAIDNAAASGAAAALDAASDAASAAAASPSGLPPARAGRALAPIGSWAPAPPIANELTGAAQTAMAASASATSLHDGAATPSRTPDPPSPQQHVIVLTHGLFIRTFFSLYLPHARVRFAQNTGVFVLTRGRGGALEVVVEDDASHLGGKREKGREKGQRSLREMWQ